MVFKLKYTRHNVLGNVKIKYQFIEASSAESVQDYIDKIKKSWDLTIDDVTYEEIHLININKCEHWRL